MVYLLLFVYFLRIFFGPWQAVLHSKGARDYSSYHYAVQASFVAENPYNTQNLHRRAQKEGTRRKVHPFFYPPPALLTMIWAEPLSLKEGVRIFFWLNQFFLFSSLYLLRRWLNTPIWFLGGLAIAFTPLTDSMKMGQINILVILMLSIALFRRSGVFLGIASMVKMSPALLFFQWIAQREWRATFSCAAMVPFLSLLALPLVNSEFQIQFYTDILPKFSSGEYHGLTVPINLPANHSIADIYNQIWPSESKHRLSQTAQMLSSLTNGISFFVIMWLSFRWGHDVSKRLLQGAMICLFLLFPVYCYEHHLAFLIIPITILFSSIQKEGILLRTLFFSSIVVFLRTVGDLTPASSLRNIKLPNNHL